MRFRPTLLAVTTLILAACSSDSSSNTPALAGTYIATTFKLTPPGGSPVDVLAASGSLTITINSAGVSSGEMSIPASISGEDGPIDVSMAGTAILTGSTVTFTQAGDTFVRDLDWTLSSSGLTAINPSGTTAPVTVTLQRQ